MYKHTIKRTQWNVRLALMLATAVIGIGSNPAAFAALTSPGGNVQIIAPPASVAVGDLKGFIFAFPEQRNATLAAPLAVNAVTPGLFNANGDLQDTTIPAGKVINSYYLHFEGSTNSQVATGAISFGGEIIVGVIERDGDLNNSNILGATNTNYPGALSDRGYEFGLSGNDSFEIRPGSQRLWINRVKTSFGVDDLRVITMAIPEPSTLALAALSLMGIGCRRRKRA